MEPIMRRAGKSLGVPLVMLDSCESTQAEAKVRAKAGAPHGTLVLAKTQRRGHARHQRPWFSGEGGLYGSLILRPQGLPVAHAPRISLLAAAGLLDAIQSLGLDAVVQWPSEVWVAANRPGPLGPYREIAGVLLEALTHEEMLDAVLVGFGVHVTAPPPTSEALRSIAASDRDRWTTLAEVGVPIEPGALLSRLLDHLEPWLEHPGDERHFEDCLRHLSAHTVLLGRRVQVANGEAPLRGIAESFDCDGALLLRKENGDLQRILAGEVQLLPPDDASAISRAP